METRRQTLQALRLQIERIERRGARKADASACVHFGIDAIDRLLPRHGLHGAALHEVLGQGADTEHAALPSLLVAHLLRSLASPPLRGLASPPLRGLASPPLRGLATPQPSTAGHVLWAMRGRDLFAPALSAAGLHPDRLILVEAGSAVLEVMEEALRHPGLMAVVGEIDGRLSLTASRRLQLAAETSGAIGFAIRRSRHFDDPLLTTPSAAASRWRVGALPATPDTGRHPARALGPALWRLELLRCRGTAARIPLPSCWIVERCDETHRLSLAAALADRPAASRHAG